MDTLLLLWQHTLKVYLSFISLLIVSQVGKKNWLCNCKRKPEIKGGYYLQNLSNNTIEQSNQNSDFAYKSAESSFITINTLEKCFE